MLSVTSWRSCRRVLLSLRSILWGKWLLWSSLGRCRWVLSDIFLAKNSQAFDYYMYTDLIILNKWFNIHRLHLHLDLHVDLEVNQEYHMPESFFSEWAFICLKLLGGYNEGCLHRFCLCCWDEWCHLLCLFLVLLFWFFSSGKHIGEGLWLTVGHM